MSLYIVAGVVIAFALVGVWRALHESDYQRAQRTPVGSTERLILEGRK